MSWVAHLLAVNSEGKFLMKLLSAGSGGEGGRKVGSRTFSVSVGESLGSAFRVGLKSLSCAYWLCDLG